MIKSELKRYYLRRKVGTFTCFNGFNQPDPFLLFYLGGLDDCFIYYTIFN